MLLNHVYNKSCEAMDDLEEGSVDLVCTSPPYFNLRDYAIWATYAAHMTFIKNVLSECYRVLKPGAWICWNIQECIPKERGENDERLGCYPLLADTIRLMQDVGFCYEKDIIWYKGKGTATQKLFGCFEGGTRVRMADGRWIPIRDVQVGENVLSYDESTREITPQRVSHKHENGWRNDLVEVYTRNRTIKCTPDHRILVLTRVDNKEDSDAIYNGRFFRVAWKEAGELICSGRRENRDLLLFPDYQRSSAKPLEYSARLLGLFIGDGWCNHRNGDVSKVVDFEIWDEARGAFYIDLIRNTTGHNPFFNNSGNLGTLHLVHADFARWLRDNNFDHPACEKIVPDIIFQSSLSDRIDFIRGYLDSDGSVEKGTDGLVFSSCSRKLTCGIKCLFEGLGVVCSNISEVRERAYSISGKTGISKKRYVVKIGKLAYERLRGLLDGCDKANDVKSSCRVKACISLNGQDFIPQRVLEVVEAGEAEVFDLTVENTATYIAEGVVVHNSYPNPSLILVSGLTEHIITCRKPKGKFKRDISPEIKEKSKLTKDEWGAWAVDLWEIPPTKVKGHTAPYPLELANRCIRLNSFWGDVVLDPFMGSGQTAIAARRCGRNFVGYEYQAEYAKLIQARLRNSADMFEGE